MTTKRIYAFTEADGSMTDLLGGKGANLAEMVKIGLPVPPGFTITTDVCAEYYSGKTSLPEGLMDEARDHVARVEKDLGKGFGSADNPLLVSVRSGAKHSMPGMMDTILNLGLNDTTLRGLIKASGDERFAYDAYRRFISMFSDVALGVKKERFEEIYVQVKSENGWRTDPEVTADALKGICGQFLKLVEGETGQPFPTDPWEQLEMAIDAVFRSWQNERAIVYRRRERIPDEIGTAVNVQAMVYGNLGDDCGTGVAFTRDPSTGENSLYGEYLMNAQGEDVVAGVRTPVPISELERQNPAVYGEFTNICDRLEAHYKEMMDLEFTIEKGRLFMLQCRVGKRTGAAAVTIVVDMVDENLITRDEGLMRISADHLDQMLHPRIDEVYVQDRGITAIARGLAASPGAAVGQAVFDADIAQEWALRGERVILVREETNPDDVHGMLASQGILTSRGGKTSHAAVVARGFGIPCVAGCEQIDVNAKTKRLKVGENVVNQGDWITINGSTGELYQQELSLIEPEIGGDFGVLMKWADEIRTMRVRANADNPRDSLQALEFGAEGIGLCRTEHMFFESDRLPIVREMILAQTEEERESALIKLEAVQQADFEAIFDVMDGLPVTIRLIDPPLHEFLPSFEDLLKEVTELRLAQHVVQGDAIQTLLEQKEVLMEKVLDMQEQNPMLGLRGCRLSIMFPGIVKMQTRAILQAAIKLTRTGRKVTPEIMIPLVGHVNELKVIRADLESVVAQVFEEQGAEVPYTFGTMIEIPRAALTSGEIAEYAEFFSFGTNDLTQTTYGYSRDDAEGKFLQKYVERKILPFNPFETIDEIGVGRLMRYSVDEGRAAREGLKCGICGEHGGDPQSIDLCHRLGLDYVSCSPYRVPIARLAAAQAALRNAEAAEVPAGSPSRS